jgi:hypothetical protein
MTKKLDKLVVAARASILHYLKRYGECTRLEAESYVRSIINIKFHRDGSHYHSDDPIYNLAIILAYKELEREGQIEIHRAPDIPFPATDFKSKFILCH